MNMFFFFSLNRASERGEVENKIVEAGRWVAEYDENIRLLIVLQKIEARNYNNDSTIKVPTFHFVQC